MIFKNHNKEEFLIAHFQGKLTPMLNSLAITQFMSNRISIPDNIRIITTASKDCAEDAMLLKQLRKNNIPFLNPASNYEGIWINTLKIDFILEGLMLAEQETAEYALVLDGLDVLFTGDTSSIIPKFEKYGTKVLFGATKNKFPEVDIDEVADRDRLGSFKYLNSGTAFGKVKDLIWLFNKVKKLSERINNPYNSDQFLLRHVFGVNQDKVAIDYNCTIYQLFGKARVYHPDNNEDLVVVE